MGVTVLGDGILVPSEIDGHDGPVSVYVRPHDFDLSHDRNGRHSWPGRVVRVTPLGAFVRLEVELTDGTEVRVELSRERCAALEPHVGESLFVAPRDLKIFLDQSQAVRAGV
jgi:sulfate transport system ATP-binding protein